jgi:EmrB/QacA subfamily drug resistance transporter
MTQSLSRTMSRTGAQRVALATLCVAQFMLIVDVVVLNVTLPSIKRELDIADAQLPLAGIAYTLTFGSLLIVAGRAGDLFGRRRIFLAGLTVFTAASVATGMAQGGWQLFASRAAQGCGAALVSPTALALLMSIFPEGATRNRAMGLWAAVGSGGAIAGQLLGGVITEAFGWRWVFLLNAPVGLAALALVRRIVPESHGTDSPRLDVAGAGMLAAGVAALSLALSRISDHGLDAWFVLAAGGAGALLAAFVAFERRQAEPLVRFGLLRLPGVRTGNGVLALLAGATGGALFFATLYLQLVLGYSAMDVGLAFAPVTLVVLAVSPVAGRLATRWGTRRLLVAGSAVTAVGLLNLTQVDVGGSYAASVLPGLVLVALGNGLAFAPTMISATSGVPPADQGLASGVMSTAQELGTALGLALLASIATAVTRAHDHLGVDRASTTGYRAGFLAAAALVAVATLVAWRGPRHVGVDG